MKESDIEKAICEFAAAHGILAIKLSGPNDRGKPDRMFLRGGTAAFLEIKATGKRPTALQKKWLSKLDSLGFHASSVDSISEGVRFLKTAFHPLNVE